MRCAALAAAYSARISAERFLEDLNDRNEPTGLPSGLCCTTYAVRCAYYALYTRAHAHQAGRSRARARGGPAVSEK